MSNPGPDCTPIPTPSDPQPSAPLPLTKWWAQSLTIWGALLTAATTVLPALAQAFGLDLPAPLVRDLVSQISAVVQAVGGLAGIVLTIAGRLRATHALERRQLQLKL